MSLSFTHAIIPATSTNAVTIVETQVDSSASPPEGIITKAGSYPLGSLHIGLPLAATYSTTSGFTVTHRDSGDSYTISAESLTSDPGLSGDAFYELLIAYLFTATSGGTPTTSSNMHITIPISDVTVGTGKAEFLIPVPANGTITQMQATLLTAAATKLEFNLERFDNKGDSQGNVFTTAQDMADTTYLTTTTIGTATANLGDYFQVNIIDVDGTPENFLIQITITPA
jgi:hypothetical protein